MREIIVDTETTGLDPAEGHRVVEIACLELVNCIPSGRVWHCYLDPERDMPQVAFEVHGLSVEFLSGKPRFEERAEELLAFLEGAMLIMHNASFDVTFLNAELERVAKPRIRFERVVDTLAMARRKHPGSACSLDALCKRYGIDLTAREKHSALLDCKLLAAVYAELVGGHQARLEFAVNGNGGVNVEAIAIGTRIRPAPLPSRLSDEERCAHRDFVASLGADALWLPLLAEAS
ncbi:MAG TPA: DNA polymerase III subunit epsilon [Methyloceanibacter sp.]|nr:DNA polymerase III subunit epsilon [Methyloceanibacter sp.]